MKLSKSTSYTQPTNPGTGVDLYNLTGNSPLDPMSTRNKELFKRKKEMNKPLILLEQIKKAQAAINLVKEAVDWNKLMSDPKYLERLKQRMETTKDESSTPSSIKNDRGFVPKKKREDMSLEEIAEEDEKQLKREMEKAKVQQGKLHLSEESAAIVQKMVDFILAAPIDSDSYAKQKQIVQSILSGYKGRDSFTPGWKRDLPDGSSVYVLTTSQLSLITAIYHNAKDTLENPKEKKEKPFGKIKTVGPTTDEKMSKWKELAQKKMEESNKKLFKQKGLEYPSKSEDILDLDE